MSYQSKTANAGGKWANRFAPYAQTIDRVVATLPPKSTDVTQNVMQRVAPIATALRQQKTGVVKTAPIAPAAPRRF